ncbi:protein HBS1 [Onthophagus taurus]|uniref:protein HBS1 n=1 Tax=Onthophagus taurus TaxID=166361 RepID=UPI0039BEA513
MARHRNIRSMNFSDECDAYDDVYGHSVEEDFCMSPSDAAFIYDREGSRNQQRIGQFFTDNIREEDESDVLDEYNLSEADKIKLNDALKELKETLGSSATKKEMAQTLLDTNFDVSKAANILLDKGPCIQIKPIEKKEKAIEPTTITVIASSGKSTNVIKGFDILSPKDTSRLNTSRPQSPISGRGTPVNVPQSTTTSDFSDDLKSLRVKESKTGDPMAQYKKEREGNKENLYMVIIGHVDAGKSTLMGHLLCSLGQVNQKTMHKYEQESKKLGKQSFMYAWVLDETGEERTRGITMDVGRSQFETKTKMITLLDAPGHKDFIPNMISGAGQADVALLVVDATRGEFETGFDFGGQTREHALLVRSLGVSQLAVAINKLDTVSWSKMRFDEIQVKLKTFLKQAGFRESDVTFVPCSGLTGQNLIETPTENELLSWYKGPTLIEVIDNFRCPERPISKPFRFSVNDMFKGTGANFCVSGKVETGVVNVGDRVLICPCKELGVVKGLSIEDSSKQIAFAGDQVAITISGVEMQNVSVGFIVCDPLNPTPVSSKFEARIVVFNLIHPITKGFSVILHHQSLVEPAVITRLIAQLNKSTGEIQKKHPRFISNNTSASVEIQTSRPIALELYSEYKELGRIMIRVNGKTIAAGLITKIVN